MSAVHNATQRKVAHRPGAPGELGPRLGVQVKVSTARPLADAQCVGAEGSKGHTVQYFPRS